MKQQFITFLILFLFIGTINAQTATFNSLLQKHVDDKGNVNYKAFKKDKKLLDEYTAYLEKTTPDASWSANKKKAFWINAYNAYTLQLILENYPIKSITKIKKNGKSAWHIPFAKVANKTYTLDKIEHSILRKNFKDPKIHVGVNCASGSCPQLANVAFTEDNLENELTRLMKIFINDSSRNKISEDKIQISKIFDWFKGDFTSDDSIITYLNTYSDTKINPKAKVSFLKYDWNLNEK